MGGPAPKIEQAPILSLHPDERNPRKLPAHEAEALKRSLSEYGAVEPAVINKDGTIIGGHQRVEAARQLGWDTFPVVRLDLSDEKAQLLNLALNRISGTWDEDKLAAMLSELEGSEAPLELSGFDTSELDKLLEAATEVEPEIPEPTEPPAEPETQVGDVIQLGHHRLLCGDATDADAILALVGEEGADAMWTDPPYGVEYVGKTEEALTLANDRPAGIAGLLHDAFRAVDPALAPGAALYVAHPAGPLSVQFQQEFTDAGWQLRQTLIWVKDVFVLGVTDYHYRHEPILFGYKPAPKGRGRGRSGWYGGNAEDSIFEVARPKASREHPTMKPVELIEAHLRNSSPRGGVVLDPFAGSGSTLLACERLNRACFAVELDPGYCDVIVKRWETYTGKEADRGRTPVKANA